MRNLIYPRRGQKITVLTGAGISAESGINTFRDSDGLWENHRVEDVATPQGFYRDPALVWSFYRQRWEQSLQAKPNPAHVALVKLEEVLENNFTLITQNVDGLHRRAGSKRLWEMHGRLDNAFCRSCGKPTAMAALDHSRPVPTCPYCKGMMRPDIVWFGEIPYFMEEIYKALSRLDWFIVIGTSGLVAPASQLAYIAKSGGARVLGINLEAPENAGILDDFYQGKAGELLPGLVDEWLL